MAQPRPCFVHLTAGDAGLGIDLGGRKHPSIWRAKNGAEAAIRFMADADAVPGERIAAPGQPIAD